LPVEFEIEIELERELRAQNDDALHGRRFRNQSAMLACPKAVGPERQRMAGSEPS
jgi:hypothetical protein